MKLIMENWKKYLEEQSGPERSDSIILNSAKRAIRNSPLMGGLEKIAKTIDEDGYPGEEIVDRYIDKKAKELMALGKKAPKGTSQPRPGDLKWDDIFTFVRGEISKYKKTDLKQKSKTQKPTDNPAEFDPTDHRNWRSDL